jgi:aerobic carbon-monoxide dehydrogenase large subunit
MLTAGTGTLAAMSTEHEAALRREDPPLLRGEGTFIDGLQLPELAGAYHAVFVRSIEPHARITGVDTGDALAIDGVVAVFTGDDLRNEIWPMPPRLPIMNKAMIRPMLANDVVRFVGEPLAVVIATTRASAVDGAEAVIVDYDPLPVLIDIEASRTDELVLHEAAGTNVSFEWESPPFDGDPFAACDVVIEFAQRHPRLSAGPMEPRAGASVWGPDGRCTTWVSSQRPAGARYVIECALGLELGQVRAIAPDVGGGFGAKGGYGCYPEDVVVAWVARHLGHATRWVETRSEAMTAMGHGRASTHRVRVGARADGKLLAYSVDALQDSGAYPAMGTFITTNLRNSGTGVYDIPSAYVRGTSVVTNTNSTNALRGAGRPEAACDIERAIDRVAAAVGLDPLEIRLRNLVAPDAFPYKTATGSVYDSGNYEAALRRCVEAAGYDALRAEQAERRSAGGIMQLGIGVSCTVESTAGADSEESTVSIDAEGRVIVVVGTSPHGQSHEHTFAAVVAAELGVHADAVTVLHSDTDIARFGGGTIGSRSAQLGGSAAYGAAHEVIELAKPLAASLLEAAEADIVFDGGRFFVAGTPARSLGWIDVGPLAATHKFASAAGSFAFGACVAAVELDTETGDARVRSLVCVDDAGTILQPQLAEGQVHGGLGMAIAAAMFEEMIYSEDGVPLTSNFLDYPLVSAAEMPSFVTIEMETPSPLNPLGVKGIGESGTVVGTAALQSAVLDALRPYGVEHLDLPLTPHRVWQAINASGD